MGIGYLLNHTCLLLWKTFCPALMRGSEHVQWAYWCAWRLSNLQGSKVEFTQYWWVFWSHADTLDITLNDCAISGCITFLQYCWYVCWISLYNLYIILSYWAELWVYYEISIYLCIVIPSYSMSSLSLYYSVGTPFFSHHISGHFFFTFMFFSPQIQKEHTWQKVFSINLCKGALFCLIQLFPV